MSVTLPPSSSTATTATAAAAAVSIDLYDVRNYSFGAKEAQFEKDKSVQERMRRMEEVYLREGVPRRTVEAVLLVHKHGHPHVLLLQIGNHLKGFFKLPGGKCRPGESDVDCMRRKLVKRLSPQQQQQQQTQQQQQQQELEQQWVIGDCISQWVRPTFETYMYPYSPPHIQRPKEVKKVFLVHLPESCTFSVPTNLHFLAVPFFELYDNSRRYGPVISSIPQCMSRYHFNAIPAKLQEAIPPEAMPTTAQQHQQGQARGQAQAQDGYTQHQYI